MKRKSPQLLAIPNNALLPFLLTLLIVCLFVFSFYTSSGLATPLSHTLTELAQTPHLGKNHLALAQLYTTLGQPALATDELSLTKENTKSGDWVLGATTTKLEEEIRLGPKEIRATKAYWEQMATMHPTYRDAWVQLLYIAHNEGDRTKIQTYMEKIRALDPNYMKNLTRLQ